MLYDEMKRILVSNVAVVTFTKVSDGSTRVMMCTLIESFLPTVLGTRKDKSKPQTVIPVWDIEANDWRSFRLDKIISVEIL